MTLRRRTRVGIGCVALALGGACGSSSGGPGGADAPVPGENELSGSYAFPVRSAIVSTSEAAGDCGYAGLVPGGGYAAFAVILVDADISGLCADAAAATAGDLLAGQPVVVIQTKSASYGGGSVPDAGIAAVAPGTYAVDFEDLDDDDVCMATPLTALVDVRNVDTDAQGATTVASAVTGSVTYTTIEAGHIAGTFSVQMAALTSSGFDTTQLTPLSGSFDASGCPGL